ncbi:MAG: Crp/Fnr family transcriptional regulator [Bacteroides sp.]
MGTTMYDILLQLPLFQGLCEDDLTNILEKVKFHFSKHKVGEKILRAGEVCDKLVFLLKGKVSAERTNSNPLFTCCEYFNAPYLVEPYSLFGMNTEYISSYIAQTDVDLLTVDKSYISSELNNYPIFRINYMNIISNHAQVLDNKLWQIKEMNDYSCVINFILFHCEKPGGRKLLRIKMEHLALILGHTRSTISKVLNKLQAEGLIVLRRKEIEIPKAELLVESLQTNSAFTAEL